MTYIKGLISGNQRSLQAMGNSATRFHSTPWWKVQVLTGNWRCCRGLTAGQLWIVLGVPRTPTPLIALMSPVPPLRSEPHILMFIMDVLLKTAFCHWERSWDWDIISILMFYSRGLARRLLSALCKALKMYWNSCLPSAESSDMQYGGPRTTTSCSMIAKL